MICKKCGNKLVDDAIICPECGTKVLPKESLADAEASSETDITSMTIASTSLKEPMSKKKKGIIAGICTAIIILVIVIAIVIPSKIKANDYEEALYLVEKGKYKQAKVIFKDLSEKQYKNSAAKVIFCENMETYNEAQNLLNEGKYYDAYLIFMKLGKKNFRDSLDKAVDCIQPEPPNGQIYRDSAFPSEVSMTISLNSDMSNKYLKIYNSSDKVILTAFVTSGNSITVKLPATTIKMKTASGTNWFGETYMYGKDGYYQAQLLGESSETTTLKNNYTYTLKLGGVTNGNVPSKSAESGDM